MSGECVTWIGNDKCISFSKQKKINKNELIVIRYLSVVIQKCNHSILLQNREERHYNHKLPRLLLLQDSIWISIIQKRLLDIQTILQYIDAIPSPQEVLQVIVLMSWKEL